jgi:hypothetical protein
MAYTQSPQISTYKTIPISVDGRVNTRNGDLTDERDLQIVNMYYDVSIQDSQNRVALKRLKKRPGLRATAYNLTKASSSDVLRGTYYDVDQNAFYWAVGNKLYSVKPDSGTSIRTVATLNTSSGLVGFCSFLDSVSSDRYILISDGTDLWVDDYVATSCARVTDADMPTPHEPSPVYVDGYVFLIDANTGDIYNSNLNDPTAWTAGDFINAEIHPDYAKRLVKMRNYIVVLGVSSVEYFYDAGIASGSPLQRNASAVRQVGYITGLVTIGDITYFVGQDEKHNVGVYTIDQFEVKKVSNPAIERTIQTYVSTDNAKSRASLNTAGYHISIDGHTFYVLAITGATWIYDIELKEWYEWRNSSGTALAIEGAWLMQNGSMYLAINNQTYVSLLSSSLYQDFGVNFTCRYTTELIDAETINWKICNRLTLDCSQEEVTGTSNLTITWSDKDWSTASGATRTINVFSISPQIYRLGRFRKRSFRFEYADNYPFWLKGFYLNLNIAQI